jgi:hypothetical protein
MHVRAAFICVLPAGRILLRAKIPFWSHAIIDIWR